MQDAKDWLKVSGSADDSVITALITAARQKVEDYTNLRLVTQTIEQTYTCFPLSTASNKYGALRLSFSPVIAVSSVEYQATAGTYTTLDTSDYKANTYSRPSTVTPAYEQAWPSVIDYPEAVKVTYTVGYGAAADVPQIFKNAMLKIVAQWYENREEKVRKMPTDVQWMLEASRVTVF